MDGQDNFVWSQGLIQNVNLDIAFTRGVLKGFRNWEPGYFGIHTHKAICNKLRQFCPNMRDDIMLSAQYSGTAAISMSEFIDIGEVPEMVFDHFPIRWGMASFFKGSDLIADPANANDGLPYMHWEESTSDNDVPTEKMAGGMVNVDMISIQDAWDIYFYGHYGNVTAGERDGNGMLYAAQTARDKNVPLIAGIQSSGELDKSFYAGNTRNLAGVGEPTPRMIKCQGFLGMTLGAKGFQYSYYGTKYTKDANGNFYAYPPFIMDRFQYFNGANTSGLVTFARDYDPVGDCDWWIADEGELDNAFAQHGDGWLWGNERPGWNLEANPKWAAAKDFHDYMRAIEGVYMPLRWDDSQCVAGEASEGNDADNNMGYIYNITTDEDNDLEETYIQVGIYRQRFGAKWFSLVNRRCAANETRMVNFMIDNDWETSCMVCAYEEDQCTLVSEGVGPRACEFELPPATGMLFSVTYTELDDEAIDYALAIRGTYPVDRLVTVTSTGSITVLPGSQLIFTENGKLTVYGTFKVLGNSDSEGDSLVIISAFGNDASGLIELYGNNNDSLLYCEFKHLDTGLKIDKVSTTKVYIDNCEFSYNTNEGIHAVGGCVVEVSNSLFQENGSDGAYVYNSTLTTEDCQFKRNSANGLYAYNLNTTSTITDCDFSLNNTGSATGPHAGVRFYGCSPKMMKSTASLNGEYGLYGANGAYPIMYDALENAANTLSANGSHESFWDYSYPSLDYGHNNFSTEDDTIFYFNNNLPTFYARGNYWGGEGPNLGTQSSSVYNATVLEYYPYDSQEQYRVDPEDPVHDIKGKHGAGCIASDEDAQDDLREALDLEADHPLDAMDAWRAIIHNYPSSPAAPIAVEHLLWLTRNYYQNDARMNRLDGLVSFFENVADTTRARMLAWKARRAALWALAAQHNYEAAIHGFETIIQNPDNLTDSVFAVIDAGTLHLEAENWARRDTVNRQDAITKPLHTIAPVTFTEHRRKTDELLALLGAGSHDGKPLIPEDYFINQNYPNPFNSTTIIKYGLPEAARVNLVIYDLMGRKVKQLISEPMQAGYYTAVWDGKSEAGVSVSSGLYFYQMNAGRFNTVKKMTMVK